MADELVARAGALANGSPAPAQSRAHLPRALRRRIEQCDLRARRLMKDAPELAQTAMLDFLGDAITAAAVDGACPPGVAREVVARAEASTFAVFKRALASAECIQLPPSTACELILSLLEELAPASGVSLWTVERSCIASAGRSSRSRKLCEAARAALDGVLPVSGRINAAIVERWDRPYAALVARARVADGALLGAFLEEAAVALSPVLERDALHDRSAAQERELVGAGERRLVRLGCDLHDGPLQELVAFAEDLRLLRSQTEPLFDSQTRRLVHGRFDDLDARLTSLDRELREIAHSVRSTTAFDRPLELALQSELDALARSCEIETELIIEGDLSTLTDSQKIVVFRVVQESLSNVRKHSDAGRATVLVHGTTRFVDVTVTDDGRGFDAGRAARSNRLGLSGVAERVRLLGGEVEIGGSIGGGTQVRATLPRWRPRVETGRAVYAATA